MGTNTDIRLLMVSIGSSLVELDCADKLPEEGFLVKMPVFAPKPQAIKCVIEKLKSEFANGSPIAKEAICLCALLDKSYLLPTYFSKFDYKELKEQLKQVKKDDTYKTVRKMVDYVDSMTAAMIMMAYSTVF
jgi:hypothetical protein